ncbi:hypothetical protein PPERSA_05610 [Pseudocohnilembus persalinus]|uniref:Uncharacterized protein n=1 Tax=Pseudocohnilembus persalinus TaxID=266149 RepID=A0A0V0QGF6_PSEPJ|nr:hypothetical protein PPERSA_05610 [Pseudocohnilembus persalinus]|eukprot:KRX01210.1 hypothetical protein PPERSA_05610 [Pseudocohnilembus persalinus]
MNFQQQEYEGTQTRGQNQIDQLSNVQSQIIESRNKQNDNDPKDFIKQNVSDNSQKLISKNSFQKQTNYQQFEQEQEENEIQQEKPNLQQLILENPVKQVELNDEDYDFLKFLEQKLKKTELKIQSVQQYMKKNQSYVSAQHQNKMADSVLQNKKIVNEEQLKGSLEENYALVLQQNKKMEREIQELVEKFKEKNSQINLLIKEVKQGKSKEDFYISQIEDLRKQIEVLKQKQCQHAYCNNNINMGEKSQQNYHQSMRNLSAKNNLLNKNSNLEQVTNLNGNTKNIRKLLKTPFQIELENKHKFEFEGIQNLRKEDDYDFWDNKADNKQDNVQNIIDGQNLSNKNYRKYKESKLSLHDVIKSNKGDLWIF